MAQAAGAWSWWHAGPGVKVIVSCGSAPFMHNIVGGRMLVAIVERLGQNILLVWEPERDKCQQ